MRLECIHQKKMAFPQCIASNGILYRWSCRSLEMKHTLSNRTSLVFQVCLITNDSHQSREDTPSHNALLQMRYFVQIVTWVVSDERHLSYQKSSQFCIKASFVINNPHDHLHCGKYKYFLQIHMTTCTKYAIGSNVLWEVYSISSYSHQSVPNETMLVN